MTASLTKGPALITALKRDAAALAAGGSVSAEVRHRTLGLIGLLVVDVAENGCTAEDARKIAAELAASKAKDEIDIHATVCAGRQRPEASKTWSDVAKAAVARTPWAGAAVAIAWILSPRVSDLMELLKR